MTQAKEARGWVGIIGAIVVIIGMFLPLISVYGIKVSFFDSVFGDYSEFMDSTSMMISIAAIGLAIVCGVLYLLSKNQIGGILSVVGVVAYILAVFGTETSNYEYVMELVSTGFWVMLAGYIVMALSAVLKSVNASIDAAFGGNKR